MLVRCRCTHAGQDAIHGAGVRVANELKRKEAGPLTARCTVCGALHEIRGVAADSSKADKKKAKKESTPAAAAATK